MGRLQANAKQNRKLNAGSVMLDRLSTNTALIKVFYQANKLSQRTNSAVLLVVFLYFWLTQKLDDFLKLDDEEIASSDSILHCYRVRSSDECKAHRFKNQKFEDGKSWTYYAREIITKDGDTVFEWQPIPNSLIHIFKPFVSSQNYDKEWLTEVEKQQLFNLIHQKWRKPAEIEHFPSVKKQQFLQYITHCIRVDNELSSLTKSLLLPENKLHHRHAAAYLQKNSEQVRAEIFYAQDRYLSRLFTFANDLGLSKLLTLRFSSSAKVSKTKLPDISLLNDNARRNIPADITNSRVGVSFHNKLIGEELEKHIDESINYGSQRILPESEIVAIFRNLNDEIISSTSAKKLSATALIDYHNLCANHVALLFIQGGIKLC